MKVRPATEDDVPGLVALEGCFAHQRWSEHTWRNELRAPGRLVLVAEGEQADLRGAASFHLVADVADLDRIAVDPAHRRQGIARELLAAGLAWCAERGAQRILLEVEAHNRAAIELYRGCGFRELTTRPGYYSNGVDALVMELSPKGATL